MIHGDGRGHTIGFPTANIDLPAAALPDETFSCRVKIGDEIFLGAGVYQKHKNSGVFEVHILNFDRDIYGKTVHVELMDSIRSNHAFASLEDLKTQIKKDVNHVSAHWKRILKVKEDQQSRS